MLLSPAAHLVLLPALLLPGPAAAQGVGRAALPGAPLVVSGPVVPGPGAPAASAAWGSDRPAPSRAGVWPLAPRPRVGRGFSPPASAWGAGHRGVDLEGHPGQEVRTSLAGTVVFAAVLAGRGVVVVEHGALRTTYEPVEASVGVGDVVARGAVLGRLRVAGSHCFPRACLHWGLRRGTTYLDPLVLVGLGPLRLLPAPSGSGVAPGARSPQAPRAPRRAVTLGSPRSPVRVAEGGPRRADAWWWAGTGSGARVGLAVRRAQAL